jgi:ABC-type dipeptide/oligopeptide/nickel transport system permease subunit
MLREAQSLMLFEPLLLLVPGLALAAIALSLNLVAHGLAKWLGVDHAAA